jgi:hypothetical protein
MIRWHFAAVRQSRNELWELRNDIEKAERGIVYADRYITEGQVGRLKLGQAKTDAKNRLESSQFWSNL